MKGRVIVKIQDTVIVKIEAFSEKRTHFFFFFCRGIYEKRS